MFLDPERLSHPCEAAFEAFVAPLTDRSSVLYIYNRVSRSGSSQLTAHHQHPDAGLNPADQDTDTVDLKWQDSLAIPCPDSSADLVMLNIEGSPRRWQASLRLLVREADRCLAPGGEILLVWRETPTSAAENPLGTLWKSLARVTQRRVRQSLQACRFRCFQWFGPEYSPSGLPVRIHPFGRRRAWLSPRRWRRLVRGLLQPNIAVRASKEDLRVSHFGKVMAAACATEGVITSDDAISSILVSPKEKIVALLDGRPSGLVLKLPFTATARDGCKRNMHMLRALEGIAEAYCPAPHPLFELDDDRQYASIESRVEGIPVRHTPLSEWDLELVEGFMRSLNPAHALEARCLEGMLFEQWVDAPLRTILCHTANAENVALLARHLHTILHGMPIQLGISHGDLSVRNVYLSDGSLSGVIDWDEGACHGLPVLDAIGHLLSRQSRRGQGFSDALRRLVTGQWPIEEEMRFLERCYAHFSVSKDQHEALIILHWLHVISCQADHWYARQGDFIDQYVLGPAEVFVALLHLAPANEVDRLSTPRC